MFISVFSVAGAASQSPCRRHLHGCIRLQRLILMTCFPAGGRQLQDASKLCSYSRFRLGRVRGHLRRKILSSLRSNYKSAM